MLHAVSEETNMPENSFYLKYGVRMLNDWSGREVRRFTEDMNLEICMRLKGGAPDPDGKEPLDEKL
eukprot:4120911-Prorocentrum_lima.AAC.1